jgi:hypothetical protein
MEHRSNIDRKVRANRRRGVLRSVIMKLTNTARLAACLTMALALEACATGNQLETETTTSSPSLRSSTRVVTDEIPAEGERKIPVIQQY